MVKARMQKDSPISKKNIEHLKKKKQKLDVKSKTDFKESTKKDVLLKAKLVGKKDLLRKKVHFAAEGKQISEEENNAKGKRKLVKKGKKSDEHGNSDSQPKKKFKRTSQSDKKLQEKEAKLLLLKKKERKILRKQKKNKEAFERGKKLKALWEDLRKDDCEPEKKRQLVLECMQLIKGHAKELTYAHDTVRVLECVYGMGNEGQKTTLFEELKEHIISLAQSMYGKFFLIKVLKSGPIDQKNAITKAFYTNVIKLICHTEAAAVVEVCFNEFAKAAQRAELVQEFYGPTYRFFKSSDCRSLSQLLEKEPDQKASVIQNMKAALTRVLQKSVIQHSIVHFILNEFMVHADEQSRSEIIDLVRPIAVEMLHTKDGSRSAMHCLWHGTAKDRKAIVKSFKGHVVKVAKEEFGHMVLLALFDCVDDTKLVGKHIILELISNIKDVVFDAYGRRVLLYLLCPRDSVHFHPDVVKILEQGDGNETSKKDVEVRRAELKQYVIDPLIKAIVEHTQEHCSDNAYCLFVFTVLKHAAGHQAEAFRCIAKLTATAYSSGTKNVHMIESPGSHFMLKKLIKEDQKEAENKDCFSTILLEEASTDVLRSWVLCNRGCFLLVSILETGIPSIVQKIKEEMYGFHTQLSKKSFVGAGILLKKLKQ